MEDLHYYFYLQNVINQTFKVKRLEEKTKFEILNAMVEYNIDLDDLTDNKWYKKIQDVFLSEATEGERNNTVKTGIVDLCMNYFVEVRDKNLLAVSYLPQPKELNKKKENSEN